MENNYRLGMLTRVTSLSTSVFNQTSRTFKEVLTSPVYHLITDAGTRKSPLLLLDQAVLQPRSSCVKCVKLFQGCCVLFRY